jgi:hypothetical protein
METKYIIIFIIFLSAILLGCKSIKKDTSAYKKVEIYPADTIPSLPFLLVNPNPMTISASQLESHISKYAKVEWLAEDSTYFLPTEDNMRTVITYLDDVFRKFGIRYIPEGLDCDDFARTKTALSKLMISQDINIKLLQQFLPYLCSKRKCGLAFPLVEDTL